MHYCMIRQRGEHLLRVERIKGTQMEGSEWFMVIGIQFFNCRRLGATIF